MHITVNGIKVKCEQENLVDFLRTQNINADTKGIAVAINSTVIEKQRWHKYKIQEDDVLEIVKPFQGG